MKASPPVAEAAQAVLTLNAGSSSLKFALFSAAAPPVRLLAGAIENIGIAPHFWARDPAGALLAEQRWPAGGGLSHEALLAPALEWIEGHLGPARLLAAGHRIVHGGEIFCAPTRLSAAQLEQLAGLNSLAPLHEPHNIAAIQAVMKLRPELPQVGCFDTAFHRSMSALASRLPLPRHFHAEGVRKYGFHGLSYEYIAGELRRVAPRLAAGRVVAAHLGNGASLCAMANGKSVETSMGFTALDGLMMGTRSGAIDPGLLLYLLQERGMTAEALSALLYTQSGLLGVSGISSDMRVLLARHETAAAEAVAMFCRSVAGHVANLAVALGGLNGIVFTAGIGEHAPAIRARICALLRFLGAEIDAEANRDNAGRISLPASAIEIRVIPTDEEAMIARHCLAVLAAA